jgi:hypothetical protein
MTKRDGAHMDEAKNIKISLPDGRYLKIIGNNKWDYSIESPYIKSQESAWPNLKITKVFTTKDSLLGIEKKYENDFKSLYKWSKSVWNFNSKEIDAFIATVNSMFIAKENDTPLGFLFGTIYNDACDDSFIESILKVSPGDPVERMKQYLPMLRKVQGNYREHPYFSKLRYFIVNPALKGKGIGTVLFDLFKNHCVKEYQVWVSNDRSDWMCYMNKDVSIIAAGENSKIGFQGKDKQFLYLYSNDLKKQEKMRKENYFMDFPPDEIELSQKSLKKDGVAKTIRLKSDKYDYIKGYKYITPWDQFIEIIDKLYVKNLSDYEFSKSFVLSQLNELKKHVKNGVIVYTFKSAE